MTTNASKQYNGIILLTGYLQRLYVMEEVLVKVGEPSSSERFHKVKDYLDQIYAIIPVFEETKSLTTEQMQLLKSITGHTEELMSTYFRQLPMSFNQKLAIVGSSLFAEQQVNAGIIRLGEVFNEEVNRDFHQRVKFYQDRTKIINYLVHVLHKKEQPEEQMLKPIEMWFNDVMRNKEHILNDMKHIGTMIGF